MSYSFQNLKTPQNVFSGVADYVLLAPVSWFIDGGIKFPHAPFIHPGDEVTIRLDHEFKADCGFFQFSLAPEKNQLDAKTIGDKGFNKLDQELSIFIAGSYAEAHEAIKNLLNIPLVALAKDANCGANLYYQLGSDCVYAYLTADFSTGTTKDGVKGYSAKISYASAFVQLYAGDIQLLGVNLIGLSAVFLASGTSLSGGVSSVEAAYNTRLSSDITSIYGLLLSQADAEIIQLYLVNDQGDVVSDFELADLSSEMNFINWLENWLSTNGTDQTLTLSSNQMRVNDPGADKSYLGIAVPSGIIGDDGYVYLADDDLIMTG